MSLLSNITTKRKTNAGKTGPLRNRQANTRGSSDLTVDFERCIPTILASLVATLRATPTYFSRREYRVLVAAQRIPSLSPGTGCDISTKSGFDTAAAGRATNTLAGKALIRIEPVEGDTPSPLANQVVRGTAPVGRSEASIRR